VHPALVQNQITDDRATIGRNIKRHRVSLGLTQGILADRMGLTQQMAQKWERGSVSFTLERLGDIAKALGCKPADLLAPESSRSRAKREPERARPLTNQEKDLLAEFAKIKELSRKRLALQVLRVFAAAP